ncbi:MAG: WD40 repeat domain-containing serine/threonine-protein kinase [Cyanobacteria bacterium P01_E01_bin.6]
MSYCLNPRCSEPDAPSNPDRIRAKFCSSCGTPLLLGDRYRATHVMRQHPGGRTFVGFDEHRPSKPRCIVKQFFKAADHFCDPHPLKQFHHVAERLETLGQHPHIPALWAFFEQDDHQYLIQEYLEGTSLDAQCQQHGAFSETKIRTVFHHVLPILEFAHNHQVIHGDICAQNLLYVKREKAGVSKGMLALVGFGSELLLPARAFADRSLSAPSTTTEAAHLEQSLDHQTAGLDYTVSGDLYRLGLTCMSLLTGESLTTLYDPDKHLWQWESYVKGDVSGWLSQILNKLLNHQETDRYESASDVLADILSNGSSISHRPTLVPSPNDTRRGSQDVPILTEYSTPSSVPWQCAHTLRGHDAWVRSVAISADGQLIASGSGDKTVKLWSVETGQLLHTLTGHSTWVRGVAISPDQQMVASVSNDKTIRLWHAHTGDHLQTLTGHGDWIRAVTFLPIEGGLATAGQDKIIHVWDLKRNMMVRTLQGHAHWVLALAHHPDGKRLFSGSRDRTIRCWNLASGKCEYTLSGHTSEVSSLAITPDGNQLLSGSGDQTIRVWDIQSGQLLQTLRSHEGAVNGVAMHPSGIEFASGSNDKTIRLWKLGAEVPYATLTGHVGWVWTVDFPKHVEAKGASTLISGSWDSTINIWYPTA